MPGPVRLGLAQNMVIKTFSELGVTMEDGESVPLFAARSGTSVVLVAHVLLLAHAHEPGPPVGT